MENPYAPPQQLDITGPALNTGGTDSPLSTEGNLIVCANHSVFPNRCVVCNTPTQHKMSKTMYWHPGWIYALLVVSWLIYLIVALIVRKKGTVQFSLCEQHRKKRVIGILVASLGIPFSILAMVIGAAQANGSNLGFGLVFVFGLIGIIAFPVVGLIMAKTVIPKRITHDTLWLSAGQPFTDSL